MFAFIKQQFTVVCPFDIEKNPPLMRWMLKRERLGIGWAGIQRRLTWAAINGTLGFDGGTPESSARMKSQSMRYAQKEIAEIKAKGLWAG